MRFVHASFVIYILLLLVKSTYIWIVRRRYYKKDRSRDMFFINRMTKDVTEKREVAKRTDEVLEAMNMDALKAYTSRIERKKQHIDLLTRIFSGSFATEVANTATAERKAVNS